MTAHNDSHDTHSKHQEDKTSLMIKNLKNFLILTPLTYPFIRVQTLMQSHLTFPVGETLPNFRNSVKLALAEGGLFKGFGFYFIYMSTVFGSWTIHPVLGAAAVGLFYPFEMLQIYAASNVSTAKIEQGLKTNAKLNNFHFRGVLLNFFTYNPFTFFLNNIKRNFVLRTDDGTKTSYKEVFKSFENNPRKIFRGGVPAVLALLVMTEFKH